RLALARALLHRPPVLLLVEPFAGCDAASAELLAGLIRRWVSAPGGGEDEPEPVGKAPPEPPVARAALLLASEAGGLAELCRDLYLLDQGRLTRVEAPPQEARAGLPFKIPARLEDKVALINPSDILYVSAAEGRACLHTTEGRIPTHFTLA